MCRAIVHQEHFLTQKSPRMARLSILVYLLVWSIYFSPFWKEPGPVVGLKYDLTFSGGIQKNNSKSPLSCCTIALNLNIDKISGRKDGNSAVSLRYFSLD